MLIELQTNLPDNSETLVDILKIVSHAIIQYDIKFEITEYCGKSDLELSALNVVYLEEILKEVEK